MAKPPFPIPPSWQSGLALPGYVQNEGLRQGAFVTAWQPRGTYDDPDPFDPSWDKTYAIPDYVLAEGYGQGAQVTHWPPRGTYVGAVPQKAKQQVARALGDIDAPLPAACARYGHRAARAIMLRVQQIIPGRRRAELKRMMDAIDPALWDHAAKGAEKLVARGVPPARAIEQALAHSIGCRYGAAVALGDVAAPKATSHILAAAKLWATATLPNAQATQAPQSGQCSADGKFVWVAATPTAPGHWERLRVGQTCASVAPTGSGPTVRDQRGDEGGGGTSVTPTTVMKVGPFTIPVVRAGREYTWGLDSYDKLTSEQAAMLKEQLQKRIDYPGRSNWIDQSKQINRDWDPAPGTTTSRYFDNGNLAMKSSWPAVAPWGGPWLTVRGWLQKIGLSSLSTYEGRYVGFDKSRYTPVATFDLPDSGAKYGLWMRIQPVGGPINATATEWGPTVTAHGPVDQTYTHQLQFRVAPMPDKGLLGGFWDWIMKYVKKLVVGYIDAVKGTAEVLSEVLCAVAATPGSVEAAAAAGGPYGAAGATASKLLLDGKCPVPGPPGGAVEDGFPILPVAIAGGAVLAIAALWPKKRT